MSPTAETGTEGNFTPAGDVKGAVKGLRTAAQRAREDHYARMATWKEWAVKAARPRWVIVVGVTPATGPVAGQWQVAASDRWQVAANLAFAILLLLVCGLICRAVLGKVPLMPIAALAGAAGVLKVARVQLAHPASEDGDR